MLSDRGRGAARTVVVASTFTLLLLIYVLPAGRAYADSLSEEQQFVARINAFRRAHGVAALVVDSRLTGIARNWSEHNAEAQQSSHNPDLAAEAGTSAKLGENVGNGDSVDWLESSFEQSPEHERNLLDPDFRFIGVGVVDTPDVVWVTQDFQGDSRAQNTGGSSPSPAPSPQEPVAAPQPTPPEQPAPATTPAPAPARSARTMTTPSLRTVSAPAVSVSSPSAPVAVVSDPEAADNLRQALATWNSVTG